MSKENEDGIIFVDKNLGNPSNSSNKPLYIVVVEDPTSSPKYRTFGTDIVTKNTNSVDFNGYELTNIAFNKLKELQVYSDISNLIKQDSSFAELVKLVSFSIPWNRIINIENVTYQLRNKAARINNK